MDSINNTLFGNDAQEELLKEQQRLEEEQLRQEEELKLAEEQAEQQRIRGLQSQRRSPGAGGSTLG